MGSCDTTSRFLGLKCYIEPVRSTLSKTANLGTKITFRQPGIMLTYRNGFSIVAALLLGAFFGGQTKAQPEKDKKKGLSVSLFGQVLNSCR